MSEIIDITATRCNCLGSLALNAYEMANRVYDPIYISPTIPCYHTDAEIKILVPCIKEGGE